MRRASPCLALALLAFVLAPAPADAARRRPVNNHEALGFQNFASPQASPIALSPDGTRLYVANTTSNSVSVIDTGSQSVVATVAVGLEPVSVAVRPDGLEVWASNHVSDTVSVIDTDPANDTFHSVVETIQDLDANGVTQFDEPVGIAFASNAKAYVALSSRNDIAVVDATSYSVTSRLHVTAQEPRALAVRDGLLYAIAFESHNQTQISACAAITADPGPVAPCTIGLPELLDFATNPNLPGVAKNIVFDARIPDRDLFVYDTTTDTLVDALEGVGTLLYDVAVGAGGQVFVTQAEARNQANGDHGMNLIDLDGRMFDNRITRTTCTAGGGCSAPSFIELDPALPSQPLLGPGGDALATPYGIQVSDDGTTLVATAAGTSRLFTVSTATDNVLGIVDLGNGSGFGKQIPKGVALHSAPGGAPQTAYVLNTLDNTVSVVDVSNPSAPVAGLKIPVGSDPTPPAVRRGRIAFNSAFASSFETFSCASCHPDGNTDQLLWRIGGACELSLGCDGNDEPRTTMPIRGLANTLPLHWDGTLGDPFGGPNGATGLGGSEAPNCTDDHSCFAQIVTASQTGVMCDQTGGCAGGGELSAAERDDMATFLAGVAYPPARARRLDERVSQPADGLMMGTFGVSAIDGFKDFFTDQGGSASDPDTCADSTAGCHELPLGVATNSSTLQAFDAPTMRGMTDRWLQFSMAPSSAFDILLLANVGVDLRPFFPVTASPLEAPIKFSAADGMEENSTLGAAFIAFEEFYGMRPLNIIQMFEEATTGLPGATGRQVTLNPRTTGGGLLAATEALMTDLEDADAAGLVNLRANGLRDLGGGVLVPVLLSYRSGTSDYRSADDNLIYSHAALVSGAQAGTERVTLTASLRSGYGASDHPQPLLAPDGAGSGPTGDPDLHRISGGGSPSPFNVAGIDVRSDAVILVDGVEVAGTIACVGGSFTPFCSSEVISIDLVSKPVPNDLHLIQVRNGAGPLSNELPVCVGSAGGCI